MNSYSDNIQILQKTMPSLYQKYIEQNSRSTYDYIKSVPAKDGTNILVLEVNNTTYRFNSAYSPLREAESWIGQYGFTDNMIVFSMFGLGNGIFVRKIIEKMDDSDRLLIYEPDCMLFDFIIYHFNLTDILNDKRVYITVKGINDREFSECLNRAVEWTNVRSQLIGFHPVYDKLYMNDYRDFLLTIADNNMNAFINRNTAAKMGKAMVRNIISNLSFIKQSSILMDLYEYIPKDIPVIIVSAGPSLEKNVLCLKRAKGKSIIIATDRILDFLLDREITPDFVITLDAIKPVKYFSEKEDISIPLFTKLESNSEILDFHKGRKIWYDSHYYINEFLEKSGKQIIHLNSGGSVATAAFSVCVGLGMKRIVLIGQDLAYSGKVTHVGGVVGENAIETNVVGYIEDIYGNMVPTRHDWKVFLKWFEEAIENYPDIDVIDATEGGAKIKGSRIMTLNDVIDSYCNNTIKVADFINSIPDLLNDKEHEMLIDYLHGSLDDLDTIEKQLEQLIGYCQKLIYESKYTNNQSNIKNYTSKISDNNEKIISKPIYSLIDTYISEASAANLSNIYQLSGDVYEDQIKTYKKAEAMYQSMKKAVSEIRKMFTESMVD